jgi:dTDP-4-dehydrorhamnose reductase
VRILILGADSILGEALHDFFLFQGRHTIESLPLESCRWKSERQAKKALRRGNCELVVDARNLGPPGRNVTIQDLDINRTQWLARASHRSGTGYLYLSSAEVFSGSVERLYTEDDYPDSQELLGEMLLRCETAVRDKCERYLILRLGSVFSHRSGNTLAHMLGELSRGEVLLLGNNQRGSPVAAEDAARVVSAVVDQLSTGAELWGIYHYCSSDETNCYEFAETVMATASQYSELGSGSVELKKLGEIPPIINRALDCSKIRNTFAIIQAPWRSFIGDTVKRYYHERH